MTGEASTNSLVNLFSARVLSKEYTDQLLAKGEAGEEGTPDQFEGQSMPENATGEELEGTLNVEGDV